MTLDLRTRYDADVAPLDEADFFEHALRALAAEHAHLAVPGARELGVQPFTLETPAGAWTLALEGAGVEVSAGAAGRAHARLDAGELADLVYDRITPITLLTAGTLDMVRGDLGDFLDWWVVLRSLIDGRAAHTAGSVTFTGRDGEPLDLQRSFRADADPADVAHFLSEAGFLHLKGVFGEEEMARVAADMDGAFGRYEPDDGRSWWASTASGERRPVRLQWFQEHSPTTAQLLADDRFLRIGQLAGEGHVARAEGNLIEALVKPIGVVEGISDLPWHKDCSLGRHSYQCCGLTVGISVTGADERSGQLAVVPGSHRALVQPFSYRECWGLPVLELPTEAGDVTVHCSCTLHMSFPPVDRERRVMYTSFSLPPRPGDDAAPSNVEQLGRVREEAYKTVSQTPGHVD